MPIIKAFIAGFLATLMFHQGVYWLFFAAGAVPHAPFNMTPTDPLGIPQVFSLAFWGGVWAIPIWWLVRRWTGAKFWTAIIALGATGPSAVAMLIVFPLKGLAVNPTIVVGALILNAAWGLGVGLLMRIMRERNVG